MALGQVEYIWLDGVRPTPTLRSKTRIVNLSDEPSLDEFPEWGFDGSSTAQAVGNSSDCVLVPVRSVPDPIRGFGNYLLMCEVYESDGKPHEKNTRAILRGILDAGADKHDPVFGFEQEYTLMDGSHPYGWPERGFPQPQGPFYCGVGTSRATGRELIEDHTNACLEAGLLIYGTNAEVMLSQWEFQIGYRGFDEPCDALTVTDHHWLATYLLFRLSEEYDIHVTYDNKPIKGDWNGAGCHTNFSTKDIRDPKKGKKAIEKAIELLEAKHDEHILSYGEANHERLTGDHETCDITQFRAGKSDRGASIRIPLGVAQKGYGYLEDRRPGANSDPYTVASRLLTTICEIDEKLYRNPFKIK